MATQASVLITRTLNNMSRAGAATTRSGIPLSTVAFDWLNDTLLEMTDECDLSDLFTVSSGVAGTSVTVASTESYTLPSDLKSVVAVKVLDGTNSRKLRYLMPAVYEEKFPYPAGDSTSTPIWYTWYGTTLKVYPTPDAVYTMPFLYVKYPTEISVGTTTVPFKPSFDRIIVAGMTAAGLDHLQLFDDGAIWRARFKGMMKKARVLDEHPRDRALQGFGFDSSPVTRTGNYWNDPFVRSNI